MHVTSVAMPISCRRRRRPLVTSRTRSSHRARPLIGLIDVGLLSRRGRHDQRQIALTEGFEQGVHTQPQPADFYRESVGHCKFGLNEASPPRHP